MKKITPSELNLWLELHKFYDTLSRVWKNSAPVNDNVSGTQLSVLRAMNYLIDIDHDPIIIRDLVPHLNRSLNSISSIIDRMVKNGLVEKYRDLPDRRAIRVVMTKKGEEIMEQGIEPFRNTIKTLFSSVTADEQKKLLTILDKMKVNLKEILEEDNEGLPPKEKNKRDHLLKKLNKE